MSKINTIKKQIENKDITIVCASKYLSVEQIKKIYKEGITHFGENRADELLTKKEQLKDYDITWHFIGHLQSNKVKKIINEIDYLHSLDRLSLVKEIQKHRNKPLKSFIQLNLTNEQSKYGISEDNLNNFLLSIKNYDKIDVIGLMAMGKHNDLIETKKIFTKVNNLAKTYKLKDKSMGMSDDYLLAIEANATYLRLGRILII